MYEYNARVRSVYDADTMRLDIDCGFGVWLADQPVRLNGVDAPELGTPEGRAARDWVKSFLLPLTQVIIITYKDKKEKYGRYLADVYLPNDKITSINQMLIERGMGVPYDGGPRG